MSIKSVKIIYKYSSFTHPLTVKLAPESLAPACIGNCEMNTVRVNIMPVTSCKEMSERIFVVVCRNFRIACCSWCKEHQHSVWTKRTFLSRRTWKFIAELFKFFIKAVPAVTLAVYYDFGNRIITSICRKVYLMSYVTVSSTNNCRNLSSVKSVFKVMLNKLICCRNNNCTKLMKCKNWEPELIVTLENEHYSVTFFNA